MQKPIEISQEHLQDLLISSFRYYLHANNIHAEHFAKVILPRYWEYLHPNFQSQIKEKILEAREYGFVYIDAFFKFI